MQLSNSSQSVEYSQSIRKSGIYIVSLTDEGIIRPTLCKHNATDEKGQPMFPSLRFATLNLGPLHIRRRTGGIWLGFKKTAGLEQFSGQNQYRIWLCQHRSLVDTDPRYAVANARFQMQAVACWVFALFIFFNVTYAAPGQVAIVFALVGAAALGWLVFRAEQDRRNEAIGQSLQQIN